MTLPFLGRLNVAEYTALFSSFFLVALEAFIRVLTLALPSSLLDLFYRASRRLFNRFTSPAQKRAEERQKNISTSIRDASDFVELCRLFGYAAEEHVFQTKDGYLLGLHRLAWRRGEEDVPVNAGPKSLSKRVVYLHHGLLMNSEVWVCITDAQRCLPFVLVERGFDVWLGNNRGNKYSKKAIHTSSKSRAFWNFSIDEFAFHDIPDSIAYVLETTGQPSLSYIGFSQGTAQAFASLAIHPRLNDQINVFIALAPAMSPAGLSNGIVDALVKASPQVVFLLFGRRSILSSAIMWQALLYPPLFVHAIDVGLSFLFGWRTTNMTTSQKLAAYPHLYSYTSTKSVVHWFQIIRTKSFQMYDEDVYPLLSTQNKHTKVARYPTRNIKTPIVLVYGGSDSLVDIKAMLRELPDRTVATAIPHYEHLDFLWASDVDTLVFPHVFDALDSFTGPEHTKEEYARYRSARHTSLSVASLAPYHPAGDSSDSGNRSETDADADADADAAPVRRTPSVVLELDEERAARSEDELLPGSDGGWSEETGLSRTPATAPSAAPAAKARPTPVAGAPATAPANANAATLRKTPSQSFRSTGSGVSIDSARSGTVRGSGIRLGSSRAVGGVVATEAAGSVGSVGSGGGSGGSAGDSLSFTDEGRGKTRLGKRLPS